MQFSFGSTNIVITIIIAAMSNIRTTVQQEAILCCLRKLSALSSDRCINSIILQQAQVNLHSGKVSMGVNRFGAYLLL
jgi:hypothetical protein